MTAAQRRLLQWSRMTSKQKLADMEKEDRRRKKMLRAGLDSGSFASLRTASDSGVSPGGGRAQVPAALSRVFAEDPPRVSIHAAAAQPLYHEKP